MVADPHQLPIRNDLHMNRCCEPRRRGAVLIFVMLAAALSVVLGLTLIHTSTVGTAVATNIKDRTQARYIAEGGVELIQHYINHSSDWQTRSTDDPWLEQYDLHDGHVTVTVDRNDQGLPAAISVAANSFEQSTGSLSNGLLGLILPTLQGNVGDWRLARRGLVGALLPATVPSIQIVPSPYATDGNQHARLIFVAGIAAEGSFSQELAETLEPNTRYTLAVDVRTAGLVAVLPDIELSVLAGSDAVASSNNLECLSVLDVTIGVERYVLTFDTDADPPSGPIKIPLSGRNGVGVLCGVAFDNLQFEKQPLHPFIIRAEGTFGRAVSRIEAQAFKPSVPGGVVQFVGWSTY